MAKETTDTERLDWLQGQTRGHGDGWVCRDSINGRGMRLHETMGAGALSSVRDAIDAAMRRKRWPLPVKRF